MSRLILTLESEEKGERIPFNYYNNFYYEFYNLVGKFPYSVINYLFHNRLILNDKKFNLYTVSKLHLIGKNKIEPNGMYFNERALVTFSIPIRDPNVENIVYDYLENQVIKILSKEGNIINMKVIDIKTITPLILSGKVKYKCISPICLGTSIISTFNKMNINNSQRLTKSLINKLKFYYKLVYKKEYDDILEIKFDTENLKGYEILKYYGEREIIDFNKTKKLLKTIKLPFYIECNPLMHNFIFNFGIGFFNNYGFGSVIPTCYQRQNYESENNFEDEIIN